VVVNIGGGTKQVSNFALFVDATAVTSGVQTASTTGSHTVSETSDANYTSAITGDCAANGSVTLAAGDAKACTITNTFKAPKLTVTKVVINNNGGTKQVSDFPLFVDGAGVTSGVQVTSTIGAHTVSETSDANYAAAITGDCAANGAITLSAGDVKSCTITNNDKGGTIIIRKISDPVNAGSFGFTTTGLGYNGFTLSGGGQNSQGVPVGTYTVKEGMQLGWLLTGIGQNPSDPNNPMACAVSGSGGSSGTGDLNTQTATIDLRNGDTVTCVFENSQQGGGVTRTQGFWSQHTPLANIAWFSGTAFGHTFPGVANISGIGDRLICGRPVDDLPKVMGSFLSDISKISTGARRTALDQARMQLLQQLIAAELNASAFGSIPSVGSFAAWETALCGTDQKAISTAQGQASTFNSRGDSSTFTPGTSADAKNARAIANIPFWDVIK
jgi:hypothetical protein